MNQTYGFQLLLEREGPKNLFRILMTRDLDHGSLKGVVYDHGCVVDQYILNREPAKFEYLRTLGFMNIFVFEHTKEFF